MQEIVCITETAIAGILDNIENEYYIY